MTEAERLIEKHRRNGLLIDTNLFLLFLIGTTNESRITRFGRTDKYTIANFRLLRNVIHQFETVVTTPHVLAEVSNLASLDLPELNIARSKLREIVTRTREFYDESKDIMTHGAFMKLGLTDAAIRRAAERPVLILTDDLPLYHYITASRLDALNFNHLLLLG